METALEGGFGKRPTHLILRPKRPSVLSFFFFCFVGWFLCLWLLCVGWDCKGEEEMMECKMKRNGT